MIAQEILDSLFRYFSAVGAPAFHIKATAVLSGGSINQVYRLNTSYGDFCLKVNQAGHFPGLFEAEAKGLHLLIEAGELEVPRPVFWDTLESHTFLLLEYIVSSRARSDMMYRFGESLARLHRHRTEMFGLGFDNYMGALPQSNRQHAAWTEFFITERLEPQVRLASERGFAVRKSFENLYPRIGSWLPEEPPSLVHGDLWNGNYIVTGNGTAALIDPAVYYGHREVDIAMTTLFGGFSPDFYDAYEETYPLETGWKDRIDLYNLYPLLVHLNLFGSSYLGEILSILKRF